MDYENISALISSPTTTNRFFHSYVELSYSFPSHITWSTIYQRAIMGASEARPISEERVTNRIVHEGGVTGTNEIRPICEARVTGYNSASSGFVS